MRLTEEEKSFFKEIDVMANLTTQNYDISVYAFKGYLENIFDHYISEKEMIEDLKEMFFKVREPDRYKRICAKTNINEKKIKLISRILKKYKDLVKENYYD